MAHQVLNDLKANTQVEKFQSLKLCYIGLYHRKSIGPITFPPSPFERDMYPISVYFGMFIQ